MRLAVSPYMQYIFWILNFLLHSQGKIIVNSYISFDKYMVEEIWQTQLQFRARSD